LPFPPIHARWSPHLGPGTPAALVVAGLVVALGPEVARRLPWRWLPPVASVASLAWLFSLALIDGWERGVATRLTEHNEYLTVVDHVDLGELGHFLSTFTDHILFGSEDRWPAHVAG